MSHTVQVNLTANQYVFICGVEVNIHDIRTLFVSDDGCIEGYSLKAQEQEWREDGELHKHLWATHGESVIVRVAPERLKPRGLWRRGA